MPVMETGRDEFRVAQQLSATAVAAFPELAVRTRTPAPCCSGTSGTMRSSTASCRGCSCSG